MKGAMLPALRLLLLLMLLWLTACPACASAAYNQSWSEQPWQREAKSETPAEQTVLSSPIPINLSGREPQAVFLAGEPQNFSQYLSKEIEGESCLWIESGTNWSRSLQSVASEAVDIIASCNNSASADLYLISYSNSSIKHYNYKFQEGYNLLRLVPGGPGRIFLLMVCQGEPGGAIMLDVQPRPEQTTPTFQDVGDISIGESLVTVKSERFRGFDLYVDGIFFGSDGSDGTLDGTAHLIVGSGKTHTISVWQRDGQGGIINKSEHTRVFARDVAYTLLIS